MFCPKCGSQIPDNSIFCDKCGTRVVSPTTPSQGNNKMPLAMNVDKNQLLELAPLIASVAAIVALFLPMIGVSFFDFSDSASGFNFIFGGEILGQTYEGDFANMLLLAPGVLGLIGTCALHDRPAQIVSIVGGAIGIFTLLIIGSAATPESDATLQIGYWLLFLASVALIALGVYSLVSSKRS